MTAPVQVETIIRHPENPSVIIGEVMNQVTLNIFSSKSIEECDDKQCRIVVLNPYNDEEIIAHGCMDMDNLEENAGVYREITLIYEPLQVSSSYYITALDKNNNQILHGSLELSYTKIYEELVEKNETSFGIIALDPDHPWHYRYRHKIQYTASTT